MKLPNCFVAKGGPVGVVIYYVHHKSSTITSLSMGDAPAAMREAINTNWDLHSKKSYSRYELKRGRYIYSEAVKE
jgi:hypothetical protein